MLYTKIPKTGDPSPDLQLFAIATAITIINVKNTLNLNWILAGILEVDILSSFIQSNNNFRFRYFSNNQSVSNV